MIDIITIETPTLGDRSYVAHDGEVAVVIDPQRDLDRVTAVLNDAGVRVTHIFETHIHNDYVTGGLALAEQTGAAYHVNAADPVSFERVGVSDGDVITVSPRMKVRVLSTPGHTFTHLSYVLVVDDADYAVFTGGSLLYGSTGRPDLLGPDHKHALAHHQFASAHKLAAQVADEAQVWPTHGFGSFCSSTQADGASSTIGKERRTNPVLTEQEDAWIEQMLAGLDAWPAYYAHMAPANSGGPSDPDRSLPEVADKEVIRQRLRAGEWVVDLRNRVAFAAGHVPGSYSIGLDGQFATYLGWLIPWGTPLTLVGETAEQVAEAQRELVRIGIDELAGHATGEPKDWADDLATIQRATFADLAHVRHHRPVTILDTRRNQEHHDAHIAGALHIPLHELLERIDEVPTSEVWVHCAAGYRAAFASSILQRGGHTVVHVDDSFENAAKAGLPMA
ncbi:MAG: MBL fold metallo-hydrolase [Propionibacterium sp.]|nr:MBL fold metallo-hydrolase [Propionibacterium sp.]